MFLTQNYRGAKLSEVPPGVFVVFKIKSVTFLGFVAEAAEGKPGAALLALASLGPDQTIPTMIEDIDPDLRVVVLAGAEPTAADLSKLRFGASSPVRDDFGALLIHGGAPHVRATSPAGAVLTRLDDGRRLVKEIGDDAWFATWRVAVPDEAGILRVIAEISAS